MNLIKKCFIFFLLCLSSNVMSTSFSAYETPASCSSIIETGKDIAVNETDGFNATSTLQNFVSCTVDVLPITMSTEIMYSLFGKAIFTPLSYINKFINAIYTRGNTISESEISMESLESHFIDKVKTFPVLIASLEALTFISFNVIALLLSVSSLLYLANTMSEGTFLGAGTNTFWTFTKLSAVTFFIFPISGLGLNVIQLFIIFIAFCACFLANLIWSILPLFKYSYMNDFTSVDDNLKISKDISVLSIAQNLVDSSLCDISARQAILLNGTSIINRTEDVMYSNKMFSCLKDDVIDNSNVNIPLQKMRTIQCAKSEGVEHFVDCGSVVFSEKHDMATRDKFKNQFYSVARGIATKVISSNCAKNSNLKKGSAIDFYTFCADVDSLTFNEDYKDKKIISLYKKSDYTPESYRKDVLNLSYKISSALETDLSKSLIEDEDLGKELSRKISFSINKGWLDAGTFLFDVGNSTNIKNQNYTAIMLGLSFSTPVPTMAFLNKSDSFDSYSGASVGSSYSKNLEARFVNFVVNGDVRAINSMEDTSNIFTINERLYSLGLQSTYNTYKNTIKNEIKKESGKLNDGLTSSINKMLFPTLLLGRKFNEPDIGKTDACYKDYSNCKKMPINPIATIIDTSRTSASSTGLIMAMSSFLTLSLDKLDQKASFLNEKMKTSKLHESKTLLVSRSLSLVLSFVNMFLGLNMIISLISGYILPIVIYIYFVGNALSWIVHLILAMCGATLWMGLHLMPTAEANFAGHAKRGYILLMDIFLKPVFIVLGVFGAFMLSTILIVVFNVTIEIVLTSFSFFDSPESPIELFYNFLQNLIYVGFLIIIFFISAKAVYKIPNLLQHWINLIAYEDAGLWKEVTGLIERTFLSGIKRFLIFS